MSTLRPLNSRRDCKKLLPIGQLIEYISSVTIYSNLSLKQELKQNNWEEVLDT